MPVHMKSHKARESRDVVVRRLRDRRKELGYVPSKELKRFAELLEVTPRQARRLAVGSSGTHPERWTPCRADVITVFQTRGLLTVAHRERLKADSRIPSYPTF